MTSMSSFISPPHMVTSLGSKDIDQATSILSSVYHFFQKLQQAPWCAGRTINSRLNFYMIVVAF